MQASIEDDARLCALMAGGDDVAARALYDRHAAVVRSTVARRWGADAADDAVQEVFARLFSRPDRFDPARGGLRSFLVMDGLSRALDRWRSEQASVARDTRVVARDIGPAFDDDAQLQPFLAEAVQHALRRLSDGERAAISLAYWGGLSYREVARRLEIAEGTAKSRIRSGLRTLRTALSDTGWAPGASTGGVIGVG